MAARGNRIRETTTSTGTGTINLGGAVDATHETFVAGVGDGVKTRYCIVSQSPSDGQWEVGRGTVTDASPDTLSRDVVEASSNGDALVNFSAGTKYVYCLPTSREVSGIASRSPNMAMNPSFETVLPGTHTTAITQNNNNDDLNSQFPGWLTTTAHADADITLSQETGAGNYSAEASDASCKIVVADATSNPKLLQRWDSGEYLEHNAYAARGRYLTVAADVKLSAGTASACRLFITYDGTGGTTTYSDYKANDTSFERLFKSVLIPTDCTDIEFGIQLESATPDYYVDNFQVEITEEEQDECLYRPRLPIQLSERSIGDTTNELVWTSTTGGTNVQATDSGNLDTSWDVNDARPAWATAAYVHLQVGGVAGDAFLYANGATGQRELSVSRDDTSTLHGNGIMSIGQDGQGCIDRSDQDVNAWVYFLGWIGEGL